MKTKFSVRALAALSLLFYSHMALGCPCGCGAAGPLQLSPGETWKFQMGVTRDYLSDYVTQNGQIGDDDGPEITDSDCARRDTENRQSGRDLLHPRQPRIYRDPRAGCFDKNSRDIYGTDENDNT